MFISNWVFCLAFLFCTPFFSFPWLLENKEINAQNGPPRFATFYMSGWQECRGAASGVTDEARGAGERLAHPHALLLINEEGVGLHQEVVF